MDKIEKEDDHYNHRKQFHKPLKFGTSGLRDLDDKLTDMQIFIATKGFLNYLFTLSIDEGGIKPGSKVALAGDFRPSTLRITYAVAVAIIDSGCLVDYCGKVPTPTVSLWGFHNSIPSIMVTASHNPYGQNGVKFIKANSEVMKDEEKSILEEIDNVREIEYIKSFKESIFTHGGFFKNFEDISDAHYRLVLLKSWREIREYDINNKASELYIERYKNVFGKILTHERFVFFQQTSVGRDIIPKIFQELGAEVILAGRVDETKDFVPVDTEDMKIHILENMAELAVKYNSFMTITTDGDSDRPAVLIVRKDKDGKHRFKDGKPHHYFLKGDKLNVLASIFIKPDFVSVPASVSHKPIEVLKRLGIEVKLTKVGSPHVIKAMNDKRKTTDEDILVYGFEANGGGMIGTDKKFFDDVVLRSLPTRDAALPIICALVLAKTRGLDLEELIKQVFSGEFESHHHSGLVENLSGIAVTMGCERYSPEVGKRIIEIFSPKDKNVIEVIYDLENVKANDYDGNKIEISNEDKNDLMRIKDVLTTYVREIVNSHEVKIDKINFLDGIRIYLTNSEILHFRPSGNAAQFRVYAEAQNEERSMELVDRAIKPGQGVIVRLINDVIDGKI